MMSATQKQDAVLVVSTGGQDLKVVCVEKRGGEQTIVLRSMVGDSIRLLHEGMMKGAIPTRLVASEAEIRQTLNEPKASLPIRLQPNTHAKIKPLDEPTAKAAFETECFRGGHVEALRDKKGNWLLFPGKLYSLVEGIKAHFHIKGALVFYSDRESPEHVRDKKKREDLEKHYNKEPVATGKLIAHWLAPDESQASPEEGLHFDRFNYCFFNYLTGQIAMEGEKTVLKGEFSAYDQPLALPLVHHIENALKVMREAFPGATAVVSHTGGPGDVKHILTPAARLYFGGDILELHVSELILDITAGLKHPAQYRIPARNAVLDARHHAALRLWEGDFAGAWAVVSHIKKNDPGLPCDGWVSAIHDAASFMQGWAEPVELNPLAAVPKGRGLEKLFLLAWRVEAALQNNDGEPLIADVLRHLGTFREKLLEYLLLLGLEKMGGSIEIDEWKITKLPNGMNDKRIKIKTGYLDTRHPADLAMFFYNNRGRYQDLYRSYSPFHEMLERDIHKQCVDTTTRERDCLRAYRNRLTHNVLPADDIDKIREYGNRVRLWNTTPNGQNRDRLGACFLAMPAIEAIFGMIAPGCSPAREYRRFVGGLLDGILAPTRADCA